jgi:hypothetical protein
VFPLAQLMCRISFKQKPAKALPNPGTVYAAWWQEWMNLPRRGWVKTPKVVKCPSKLQGMLIAQNQNVNQKDMGKKLHLCDG